jgi:hypothetical protein
MKISSLFPLFRLPAVWLLFFALTSSCSEEKSSSGPGAGNAPAAEDCRVYKKQIAQMEARLLETEKNADKLENVIYELTENYKVIDNKIRLIQRYKDDARQRALLKRTASEINLFFNQSHNLLDSTEAEIRKSMLPQTSLIPMIETVRDYLTHQENLFIEVYGSIGSIQQEVSKLKKTIRSKEQEISSREEDSQRQMEEKERQARRVFYIVGSREELQRSKVVKKSGGFLGVGSSLKLSDKLDEAFFQSGDYHIIREIALGNTRVNNLITTHPKGTYLFVDTPGERFLRITNPEKFWSTSRFLVLEVDPRDD